MGDSSRIIQVLPVHPVSNLVIMSMFSLSCVFSPCSWLFFCTDSGFFAILNWSKQPQFLIQYSNIQRFLTRIIPALGICTMQPEVIVSLTHWDVITIGNHPLKVYIFMALTRDVWNVVQVNYLCSFPFPSQNSNYTYFGSAFFNWMEHISLLFLNFKLHLVK